MNRRGPGWPKANTSAGRPRGTGTTARDKLAFADKPPLLITPEGLDQFERNPHKFRLPTSRLAYLIGHDPRDKAGLARITARINDWMTNRKDASIYPDGPAPLFAFGSGLHGQDERVRRALGKVFEGLAKYEPSGGSSSTARRARAKKRPSNSSFRDFLDTDVVAFRPEVDDEEASLDEAYVSSTDLNRENNEDELNERDAVQLLDEFRKAHDLTADEVLAAARKLAEGNILLALPDAPPEFYCDRPKGENIIAFLRRAWSPWIKQGLLTRPHLLHVDPQAYAALAQWLHRNEMPADLTIPTKSEVVSAQVEKFDDLREAQRIVAAARRRSHREP